MIHQYIHELLTVAVIHFLAVMSPGPDFALTCRNSIVYSRRTGIYTSIGLALGILVHVTYCLLGIGLLISKSIYLFSLIKYLGAAYLIYIGVKALRSKGGALTTVTASSSQIPLTTIAAIKSGFLTNTLNPKATMFFLALFTQVISQHTPLGIKVLYGAEMSVATFLWFSFVAYGLTLENMRKIFERYALYVDRCFGALLVALGLKVAFASQK